MNAKILDILSDLESQKNVKILYAAESGSRAWGFPSPDSDFDCRFIFVKPMDGYLSIVESDGQIGYPVDDVLDISGWDLQKTLRLVRKCNASPFEWLQSPLVYREEAGFRDQLWTLCLEFFNPKALIFHYLGIAKGALSKTNEEGNLSVKKFFYVIRPVLAALWTQKYQTIPPMNIEPLSELLPQELDKLLKELIIIKSNAAEGLEFKTPEIFRTFIQEKMLFLELEARNMDDRNFGHQTLDQFLKKTIEKYDH
jgi:uncharacterized protein